MSRVVKILNKKFVLWTDYNNFSVYQEMCPSGYFVSQSWLIKNADYTIVIPSYNNCCREELLDMIDTYNETGKFDIKAFNKGDGLYIMQNTGSCSI